MARNLSITFNMSFMPEFMLPVCRSVEMESGMKSLLHGGHRDAPGEAAAAVSHVEDDAALAAFDHSRIDFAVVVEFVAQAGIAVRVDVAGTQFLGQQVGQRALRMIVPEIHHHGNLGQVSGLHGVLHRSPFRTRIVRRLDADDEVLVAQRHLGRGCGFHVFQIVLVPAAAHAVAHDVEEHQDAGLGAIDDAVLEVVEIAPAGAARIRHGGHAHAERVAVRVRG